MSPFNKFRLLIDRNLGPSTAGGRKSDNNYLANPTVAIWKDLRDTVLPVFSVDITIHEAHQ
jgi:hypothetical protein